jgi:hypothetical protein
MLVGSDDADACIVGNVTGFVVALWLPGAAGMDVIAAEPVGVALSRLVVETLLRASEPMTAIPAKPPVVVTLRTSERRRCEWRLRRRPGAPATEPPCGTNSDSAEVVPPWRTERAAVCARAWSLTRLRPGSVRKEAVAPVLAPRFARAGTARGSCRPTAGWRIWTPEGEACA